MSCSYPRLSTVCQMRREQRILGRREITLNLAEENEWIARTKFVAEANEALGKK